MNTLNKLINKFKPKMGANYIGRPSMAISNPYGFFDICESDSYASAYPSIRAIANEYMTIKPFAINANGEPQQNHPVINALYHPNQKDSSVSFFEKTAVSTLVLPQTYILVWREENREARPGGDFKGRQGRNIAGFTFLESPAISIRDKTVYYSMGSQEFTEDEVIVLPGGVDPYHLYDGYSPMLAAKKWATLDDYIADFQRGFFENNAIPAGHFVITASSEQDYKDTVKRMQDKHRGAGKNNNVTYTPRPMGVDGKPADAKIEWIPFAQSNKDIGFKDLFEQANKRLDLAFGVPQIVKGVDDAATYANAQVAEKTFAQRAVYPLALRNYTQITHELNRITGGLGIAITFDYEIPTVADEEKVNAETKSIEANLIRTLTMEGFSLDSIVDAFELSNAYKLLNRTTTPATIENDKPDVDEGGEVDGAPDPAKIDGVTPVNKKTKKPKLELTDEQQLVEVAMTYKRSIVDNAVNAIDTISDFAEKEDTDKFIDDAIQIISRMVVVAGIAQHSEGLALLASFNINTENVNDFILTERRLDDYRSYLTQVADSYSELTAKSIRGVLETAEIDGLPAAEIKSRLLELPELERYQAQRLARTETVRAEGNGSLFSMEQIQSETGADLYKIWNLSDDACPICIAIEAEHGRKLISEPFLSVGDSIVTSEDKTIINNFVDMSIASAHSNCQCFLTYEIAR